MAEVVNTAANIVWKSQDFQVPAFACPNTVKELLLHGNRGSGKRISDENQVLTNKGWVPVGLVDYGHKLVAPDGTHTHILDISKQDTGPLYRIFFEDGAHLDVDAPHKWSVWDSDSDSLVVKTTEDILNSPGEWYIPVPTGLPEGVSLPNYLTGIERRKIRSIDRIADGPATCFSVDHPSHQFVCQDFIVTHNSDILLWGFGRHVGKGWGPNWRGIIGKRSIPETDAIFEKAKILYQQVWPDIKYVTHPYKVFRWKTGEMLTIRQIFDLDDYNALHGSEVGYLGYDELTNWQSPDVYLKSLSLLRSSHPEVSKHLRCWSTTNPSGPGKSWVLKRWKLNDRSWNCKFIYDSAKDNEELAKWKDDPLVNVQSRPRMSIFLDTRKNKVFMDANPTYLADLAAEAPNDFMRRAWIDGDWTASTGGGMFDDIFEEKYHVVRHFNIPLSWKIDRALDWGNATPFCVLWFAQSDGTDYRDLLGQWHSTVPGDIFVIREWYGTNGKPNEGIKLPASEVARGIVEREIEWGIYERVRPGPADNQLDTELNAGWNMSEAMADPIRLADGRTVPGVQWTHSDKAAGARKTGWNMIRDRLKHAVPKEGQEYAREKPSLFFFKTLEHTIQQGHFANTPRDEKDVEDVPKRGEFHIQDTIRYRILDEGRPMSQGSTVGKY